MPHLPEQKCERCGAKASIHVNNEPYCYEHAAEAVSKR